MPFLAFSSVMFCYLIFTCSQYIFHRMMHNALLRSLISGIVTFLCIISKCKCFFFALIFKINIYFQQYIVIVCSENKVQMQNKFFIVFWMFLVRSWNIMEGFCCGCNYQFLGHWSISGSHGYSMEFSLSSGDIADKT